MKRILSLRSFNEAAAFQGRGRTASKEVRARLFNASMRPRHFRPRKEPTGKSSIMVANSTTCEAAVRRRG